MRSAGWNQQRRRDTCLAQALDAAAPAILVLLESVKEDAEDGLHALGARVEKFETGVEEGGIGAVEVSGRSEGVGRGDAGGAQELEGVVRELGLVGMRGRAEEALLERAGGAGVDDRLVRVHGAAVGGVPGEVAKPGTRLAQEQREVLQPRLLGRPRRRELGRRGCHQTRATGQPLAGLDVALSPVAGTASAAEEGNLDEISLRTFSSASTCPISSRLRRPPPAPVPAPSPRRCRPATSETHHVSRLGAAVHADRCRVYKIRPEYVGPRNAPLTAQTVVPHRALRPVPPDRRLAPSDGPVRPEPVPGAPQPTTRRRSPRRAPSSAPLSSSPVSASSSPGVY